MEKNLKVAFVSNDKKHIVGAFGSAKFFEVFTINNGEVVNQETREAYSQVGEQLPTLKPLESGEKPKFDLNVFDKSKDKHRRLTQTISDCNVVIARDMCENAKDSITQFKMEYKITNSKDFQTELANLIGS